MLNMLYELSFIPRLDQELRDDILDTLEDLHNLVDELAMGYDLRDLEDETNLPIECYYTQDYREFLPGNYGECLAFRDILEDDLLALGRYI